MQERRKRKGAEWQGGERGRVVRKRQGEKLHTRVIFTHLCSIDRKMFRVKDSNTSYDRSDNPAKLRTEEDITSIRTTITLEI